VTSQQKNFVSSFNGHYQSYEIGSLINNTKIININEFEGPAIHVHYTPTGLKMIRRKIF